MNSPSLKTVERELSKFLNKSFLFSKGDNNYAEELVLSALSNSYVETVEGKADSLHLKIKMCDWENFLEIYQLTAKKYVRMLNIKSGILIFDITPEPFYGKTTNHYTIGCEGKKGYKNEFHFLVASLGNESKEEKIPLACIPITYGFDYNSALKSMLEYAGRLFRIKLVLLDRGFYSVDAVSALQGYRYIMLIPKLDEKIKYYSEIAASHLHFYHKIKDEVLTRIVLVRDKSDKFTWSFATDIIMDDPYDYVNWYKKRWRIETNFRVEDEAKIKSKSVFPAIRYFYFLIGLLLHSIWLVFKRDIPFKKFLIKSYNLIMLENLGIMEINAI